MGREVHIKDEARFPGKWAFFGFDDGNTGKMIPTTADCYSCHAAHGAVDATFVQFDPTLLPIAKNKGTLSAGYQKERAEIRTRVTVTNGSVLLEPRNHSRHRSEPRLRKP